MIAVRQVFSRVDHCREQGRTSSPLRPLLSAFASAAVAVFTAFASGFGSLFAIIGKVAAAVLTAFASCFGCAFWIILEVATAVLATFATGLCSALRIVLEITTAVLTAFAAYFLIELFVVAGRRCFAAFFCPLRLRSCHCFYPEPLSYTS